MDFVQQWAPRCELPVTRFLTWLGLGRSKWVSWKARYGRVNAHNAWIPRDFWLEDWEKAAIVVFYQGHPLEGYRRLAYMMLDADIVSVSASSVYRVLKQAGLLKSWAAPPSKKGRGFNPPETPHQHWHVDIAYLNVAGTFFFLCSVLDGYSRFIVHWEIRPQMTEADVEIVLQRAREAFPSARPRLISDNGPQFIARDFKEFIRLAGMTHVRTSPFYPQSNGKLERWHKSLKSEAVRPKTPLSLEDAQRVVGDYVTHYNTVRLNSAIGYLAPQDKLQGHAERIFAQRESKLQAARERRRQHRAANFKGATADSTSTAVQESTP